MLDHIYPDGYYQVGDKRFTDKQLAYEYSTKIKKQPQFHWHHQVWKSFDKRWLGRYSLDDLYRRRAKQLRESYDVLYLSYSGGADSWNILNTFIKHKIKLDCVYVKWPKKIDKTFYTPNKTDVSAYNYLSEWDFTIKKDLEWLVTHHPQIKVEVVDVFERKELENTNSLEYKIESMDVFIFPATTLQGYAYPLQLQKDIESGKKVCEIKGIDKPIIFSLGNQVVMTFRDHALAPLRLNRNIRKLFGDKNKVTDITSGFYWAPEFPLLAYEQAYQCFLFFNKNKNLRWMIDRKMHETKAKVHPNPTDFVQDIYEQVFVIQKRILYPDYDHTRFQVQKPRARYNSDKFSWTHHKEFNVLNETWKSIYSERLNKIDPGLLKNYFYKAQDTPFYLIGEYDD